MSDLYTDLMEGIMPILQDNWQLIIVLAGTLFLLGTIFRWKWVCDPQGDNVQGFRASVYRNHGEKGYRIVTGINAIIIILCGVGLWILM